MGRVIFVSDEHKSEDTQIGHQMAALLNSLSTFLFQVQHPAPSVSKPVNQRQLLRLVQIISFNQVKGKIKAAFNMFTADESPN